MIIHLYTLCWNEIDILPFVIDYWKRLNIARAVVFDNGSTDGSVEFLQQYDWIEVRHYETNGEIQDRKYLEIKNNAWKESKDVADWIIVCDMDELLFSNYLNEELNYMKERGNNAVVCPWYSMCFDERPKYDANKLLHTQGTMFYKDTSVNRYFDYRHYGKFILFDPKKIDETNYGWGAHTFNPTPYFSPYISEKMIVIHINKGLSEDFFAERKLKLGERLSEENKEKMLGVEYQWDEATNRIRYRQRQKISVDINEIYKDIL